MTTVYAGNDAAQFSFIADELLSATSAAEHQDAASRQRPETPVSKEFLPRRTGESRFAPPQYVYSASRGGAVPANNSRAPAAASLHGTQQG
jgi:hypothetical protein